MTDTADSASRAIEALLVRDNPRGMAAVREHLQPGFLLRAARLLAQSSGPIGIITGFPVGDTFETDGPVGARVLYDTLLRLGYQPFMWAEPEILAMCFPDCLGVSIDDMPDPVPQSVVVIERPGAAEDGQFYNIHGENISARCRAIEATLARLESSLIAIGDGGNEWGMGAAGPALAALPIQPATAGCDELVVGDVSNWAAYALAAMTEATKGVPPTQPEIETMLARLIAAGVVDGVTGEAIASEDGYPAARGVALIGEIRDILNALPQLQTKGTNS